MGNLRIVCNKRWDIRELNEKIVKRQNELKMATDEIFNNVEDNN